MEAGLIIGNQIIIMFIILIIGAVSKIGAAEK